MFELNKSDELILNDFIETQSSCDLLTELIHAYQSIARIEQMCDSPDYYKTHFKIKKLKKDYKVAKKELDKLTDLFFSEPQIKLEFTVLMRML